MPKWFSFNLSTSSLRINSRSLKQHRRHQRSGALIHRWVLPAIIPPHPRLSALGPVLSVCHLAPTLPGHPTTHFLLVYSLLFSNTCSEALFFILLIHLLRQGLTWCPSLPCNSLSFPVWPQAIVILFPQLPEG